MDMGDDLGSRLRGSDGFYAAGCDTADGPHNRHVIPAQAGT
jgi:hypothetical protein